MKRVTYSIANIQTIKSNNFIKDILLLKDQIKIKGGINPWTDQP